MIRTLELTRRFPMNIPNGKISTTIAVWEILTESVKGNTQRVQAIVDECPEMAYAQYNYTPPIHFAVREGHVDLVEFLLSKGALDPTYITYPFKDTLLAIARDREHNEIVSLLEEYLDNPSRHLFKGDYGVIDYQRNSLDKEFENAVDRQEIATVKEILDEHPALVHNESFFWGEGILMMPAKDGNAELVKTLLRYGASVPRISKWGRFYYFKHLPIAALLMENGMPADHMTWHHVTLLHDMAQENEVEKAELLLNYGADINALEEEYQSTPLGLAVRWGNVDMVEFLLKSGADPNKAGASWATPLAWATKKGHAIVEKMLRTGGANK